MPVRLRSSRLLSHRGVNLSLPSGSLLRNTADNSVIMLKTGFVVVALMSVISPTVAVLLDGYGADPTQVSVSGVSSGAAMAVQLHVAYSSSIMGMGAVAGVPYYCARGNAWRATGVGECAAYGNPDLINMPYLVTQTETWASQGKVDDTNNLTSAKVYFFSGSEDIVVPTDLAERLEEYYGNFITDSDNNKTVHFQGAGHAFITDDNGLSCGANAPPFINDCNYNMAFEMLNHIYGGNLQPPTSSTVASGQLLTIYQAEFFQFYWPLYRPMDYYGHLYVPTGCASSGSNCKLHVALHGCLQTEYMPPIIEDFYTDAGYNEVGELNNIIILYPEVFPNIYLMNPGACWDWWGYTGSDYAIKSGWEMKTIKEMIDRILE